MPLPGRVALVSPSPSSDADAALLIGPSWRSFGRWERHVAGLLALCGAVVLVRLYGRHPQLQTTWITLGIFGVILAGYAADVIAYMFGTWFRVTADTKPVVFVFSPTGRCVLSLYAFRWDQADLDRI